MSLCCQPAMFLVDGLCERCRKELGVLCEARRAEKDRVAEGVSD
jgi:hypothetical protein